MSLELASILVLVAMFAVASSLPVNLGVLAFAASYGVGVGFGGLSVDEVLGGFPGALVVLLLGVTYLFAIATANGTVDWLIDRALRLVGGRAALVPWVMYTLTALLAAAGALAVAALACVAPLAMRFARRYDINPLMMAVMVCLGSVGGSFSPISPFGVIVNGTLGEAGIASQPGALMLGNLAATTAIAGVVFLVLGRFGGGTGRAQPVEGPEDGQTGTMPASGAAGPAGATAASDGRQVAAAPGGTQVLAPTEETAVPAAGVRQWLTLTAILGLVIGVLFFDLDVGLLALVIAAPLSLLATDEPAKLTTYVPWSVILMVAGMLSYIAVMTDLGALTYVSDAIDRASSPLLAALLICYVAAIVSAFAATAGVLVATVPLMVPLLQGGDMPVLGLTIAVCISATIVDSSPMSTNGALLLANQSTLPERRFFRQLLGWAGLTIALGPPLAWAVFVLPFA